MIINNISEVYIKNKNPTSLLVHSQQSFLLHPQLRMTTVIDEQSHILVSLNIKLLN